MTYEEQSAAMARLSNPWTVEIQRSDGYWQEFSYDAPLTLVEAEARMAEHRKNSPEATFRLRPWMNADQRNILLEQESLLLEAAEVIKAARWTGSRLAGEVERLTKQIDSAWHGIEYGWEIEERAWFEKEAPRTGDWSPLAMAVHYMWKRDLKEKAVDAEVERLREALTEIADYVPFNHPQADDISILRRLAREALNAAIRKAKEPR